MFVICSNWWFHLLQNGEADYDILVIFWFGNWVLFGLIFLFLIYFGKFIVYQELDLEFIYILRTLVSSYQGCRFFLDQLNALHQQASSLLAEVWAVKYGLILARELGIHYLLVKLVATEIFSSCQQSFLS